MSKSDSDKNIKDIGNSEELKTLEDYDRKLEEMEAQIKELKKIKKRKKRMVELEMEKEEIVKKMNKVEKNKHR